MKREGWQHGKGRANPAKLLKCPDGNPSRAPTRPKPTNASKMTGKCRKARCGSCHLHPASKAKDKVKGAQKLRAGDVALNHRLATWRVVDDGCDGRGVPGYKGVSASAVLACLSASRHSSNGSSSYYDDAMAFAGAGSYTDMTVGCSAAASAADADEDFAYGLEIEAMEKILMQIAAAADPAEEEEEEEAAAENTTDLEHVEEEEDDADADVDADSDDDVPSLETDNNTTANTDDAEDADDEEDMGFFMVGVGLEYSVEEDWLVVEEM